MGFATGDLHDVVHAFTRDYFLSAYRGFYLPLDDVIEDLVPDYDDYYESAMENIRFEGKLYGLLEAAYIGPTAFLMWNPQLVEEAGAEPPWPDMTMDDLFELAMTCTNTEKGIFGIEMNHNTPGRICNTLRTYGKPEYGVHGDTSSWLVSPDGKQFRFLDNPAAEEYFTQWYRPLQDAGAQPRVFESGLFQAGQAALFQAHHGWVRRLEKDCEWGFEAKDSILMPVGAQGRRGTSQESHMKCVSSETEHVEEALRLCAFITGTEAGKLGLEAHGALSARKSVYNNPELWERYPHYKLHHELLMSEAVEPYPMPWNFRDPEVRDAHSNLFAPLYAGEQTFEEIAPAIQEEIQKIFDQPRP
jgi:ABC-type glycerol-3-phosphate transport system substrate-binding protein